MNGEALTAAIVWGACLVGLLILHLLVELTDIQRELRRLRRRIRRMSAAIPHPGRGAPAPLPQEKELK